MSVTELSFAAALQRLGDIRRDLQDVADPDVVDSLEHEATTLAEHCRALLRRPRAPRGPRQLQTLPTEGTSLDRGDSGAAPFDQFAGLPGVTPLHDDDATVSISASPPVAPPLEDAEPPTARDTPGQDSPTEALESPQRTITLPGDAPTDESDDDSPTSVLNPPR